MPFPTRTCTLCSEDFELKPNHAGYANRCPTCNAEPPATTAKARLTAEERKSQTEANEARRDAMRNLLYRKDS